MERYGPSPLLLFSRKLRPKNLLPTPVIPLCEHSTHVTTDKHRQLLFAADFGRIKSYKWGSLSDDHPKKPLPVNTLNTSNHSGALYVVDGRSIWRAGACSVAIWNIDDLETYGPDGTSIIGREFDTSYSSRDEDDEIEPSCGSSPHNTVPYAAKFKIDCWSPHPQNPVTMFCASDTLENCNYSCCAVDVDQGGRVDSNYLSHRGAIGNLSTSPGDPNPPVPSCTDGYARIFDLRRPLPVMLFDGVVVMTLVHLQSLLIQMEVQVNSIAKTNHSFALIGSL